MGYGIIYSVLNTVNGKWYIGQTIRLLESRKATHMRDAKTGRFNMPFHKALMKYGFDAFEWTTIETCENADKLNEREIFYIEQYQSFSRKGYNRTLGGGGKSGCVASEETRQKLREAASRRMPISEETRQKLRDKIFTEEHRRKISETRKGILHTEESKRRMSEIKKGKISPLRGRALSEETRRKISEARKGISPSEETRRKISEARKGRKGKTGEQNHRSKRYKIEYPDGTVIEVVGLREFCRQKNIPKSSLSAVGRGERKDYKGIRVCEIKDAPESIEQPVYDHAAPLMEVFFGV